MYRNIEKNQGAREGGSDDPGNRETPLPCCDSAKKPAQKNPHPRGKQGGELRYCRKSYSKLPFLPAMIKPLMPPN